MRVRKILRSIFDIPFPTGGDINTDFSAKFNSTNLHNTKFEIDLYVIGSRVAVNIVRIQSTDEGSSRIYNVEDLDALSNMIDYVSDEIRLKPKNMQ